MSARVPDGGSIDAVARAARRAHDAVERIRGGAQTPDGAVRIEVGVDGRISELHLDPVALRADAGWLARVLVDLHSAALEDASAQARPVRAELLHEPAVAQALRRLDPVAASAAVSEPASVPVPNSEADDYYATFSVMRSGGRW
ncbi:YbaB/EbfC family nucleoid-associated protein [Rhodococcus triatomae]